MTDVVMGWLMFIPIVFILFAFGATIAWAGFNFLLDGHYFGGIIVLLVAVAWFCLALGGSMAAWHDFIDPGTLVQGY
jgi:hypothetical protein